MEQRARVMGKKAEAAVYRKYIEKMKKITKERQMKKKNEDAPATNTSSIPNPAQTAMGPKFTTTNVMDRRRKKRPDVLKRFRQHMMDSA